MLYVQFNPEIPAPIRFSPLFHESANYDLSLGCYSCSLQGEFDVVTRFGYYLLTAAWKDAVFVRHDIAHKLYGPTFRGLDPVATYHAARFREAGRCQKFSEAVATVKTTHKITRDLRICESHGLFMLKQPIAAPRPPTLCMVDLKLNKKPKARSRGHFTEAVKRCSTWFAANANNAASTNGSMAAHTLSKMRKVVTKSCQLTQARAGTSNPWGSKHKKDGNLNMVPFAMDSPRQAGDFAQLFGLLGGNSAIPKAPGDPGALVSLTEKPTQEAGGFAQLVGSPGRKSTTPEAGGSTSTGGMKDPISTPRPLLEIVNDIRAATGIKTELIGDALTEALEQLGIPNTNGTAMEKAHGAAAILSIPVTH